MGIGRDELEQLTRADLVQRATALGVGRADVLTRPELIDEIVSASYNDEQERTIARGLLGRARDLVARVMEKGLHLPDAAQRIRTSTLGTAPEPVQESTVPEPIPTVALAQVYARQGHRAQARRIIEEVLKADPANAAALTFRDGLDGAPGPAVQEQLEHGNTDQQEPAAKQKPAVPTQDSMAVVRDQGRMQITWQLRPATFARNRARVPGGRLVLRLVHTLTSEEGPQLQTDDRELDRLAGSTDVMLPNGVLSSHAALGWRDGSTFQVLVTEPQ
jgi:hypothetical protein